MFSVMTYDSQHDRATLGKSSTLDRFDWNHPRQIDRRPYETLHSSLDFLDRGDNVLLRGPSGVGKTTPLKTSASPPSAAATRSDFPASLRC